MAETELTGKVVLTADATAAKREIDKLAGPDAQRAGESFSSRFGSRLEALTRRRVGRFVGAFGLGGVGGGGEAGGTVEVKAKQDAAGFAVLAGVVGTRLRTVVSGLRNMGSAVRVVTNRLNGIGVGRQLTGPQRLLTGPGSGLVAGAGLLAVLKPLALRFAGIALVAAAAGIALKIFTGKVLGIGRTLAGASGVTAAAFARFDARMFLFTNRLGNRLGPAFDRALTKITNLLVANEELIGSALTGLVSVLGFFVTSVDIATKNLQGVSGLREAIDDPENELTRAIKGNTKATEKNTDARMGRIDAPEQVLPELLDVIRAGVGGVVPIGGAAAPAAAEGQLPDLLRDLLAQQEQDRQRVVDQEKDQGPFVGALKLL